MTRLATLIVAWSVIGAACAVAPAPKADVPDSPPLAQGKAGVMHLLRGDAPTFVACVDCPAPTPKTVARTSPPMALRVVQASATPGAAASPPGTLDVVIPFDNASAKLSSDAISRLDALKPLLPQVKRIRVLGFTDNQGSMAANKGLAEQRALQVMLQLRGALPAEGVDLSATGRPLCCYVASNAGPAGRAPNRRAEVHLEFGRAAVATTSGARSPQHAAAVAAETPEPNP